MKGDKKGIGLEHALNGLKVIFKHERNFKIHLLALIGVFVLGLIFQLTYIEWSIILVVSALVFCTEIINSAIELTIDYLNPTIHPSAKKIKDMSASAVLIASICSIVIGILIFLPKVILIFK